MKTCSVDGCENVYYAKEYCNKHWQRFKKHGNPLFSKYEEHNMVDTTEYHTWAHMKQRCLNPNDSRYHRYGGRGITICDRWKNSFLAFYKDMGYKPFPEAQLDRTNNDGNYEPSNCRWVTCKENNKNRSNSKKNRKEKK